MTNTHFINIENPVVHQFTVPKTKFILPTAHRRPISLNRGMAMPGWSDIYGLSEDDREDKAGFEESRERVEKIVASELAKGIISSKMILAGFSQGGALALHTVIVASVLTNRIHDSDLFCVLQALRSEVAFGGCVALSTWLPFKHEYPDALSVAASTLKIFQVHGTGDAVVRFEWGLGSHKILKSLIPEPSPQFMSIQDMGHSSHPNEIAAVNLFLKEVFRMRE